MKTLITLSLVLFASMVMAVPQAEAQTTHPVDLTWTQQIDSGITITNTLIFRGTVSNGLKVQVGQTGSGTARTWRDNSVAYNTTYYYVVAAVSSTGQQSADSNEASAVIPQQAPSAPASLTTKVN
jgi:hypothetical protein